MTRFVEFCAGIGGLDKVLPIDVLNAMHPLMTGAAEGDAVVGIEASFGMVCPHCDVMSAELIATVGIQAASLAGVSISGEHRTPPGRAFSNGPYMSDSRLAMQVVGVGLTPHPVATSSIGTIDSTLEGIPTGIRAVRTLRHYRRRKHDRGSASLASKGHSIWQFVMNGGQLMTERTGAIAKSTPLRLPRQILFSDPALLASDWDKGGLHGAILP